jgi:spermidine/putrescine transport system ATP-binding protein
MGGGEIRLVGLVKRFEDVTAVDGIDLDVPGGEFFALLGPSGCGKTTTLRLVAGFEQPTGGRILLDGVDMVRTPPHKRKVNTVFQSYALFPFLSVRDNVAFGMRFQDVAKAEARRRVAEALALVQLQGLERRRPAQLSGAASSSGSPWPGRWSSTRRCCCWTSRSGRWTPSCARPSRSS